MDCRVTLRLVVLTLVPGHIHARVRHSLYHRIQLYHLDPTHTLANRFWCFHNALDPPSTRMALVLSARLYSYIIVQLFRCALFSPFCITLCYKHDSTFFHGVLNESYHSVQEKQTSQDAQSLA
ncbi:hypothetical protein DEU56DRAFT_74009 [Suillus clintonianus]|uniref:uncharacterized protein n=1 Tax=Suillus clintonianus TaxID=1904413 RepID=UPI001B86C077|nr:uncharacterized protein DEU56DRAFT_74009 [Suillus clintonianus]KAG2122490.1 hypothetical protein DEU56DRAFT_74009 [Suillus clintonianus]